MNILPKKRWHVRTKDNIARVRRDEAEAAEQEKERIRRAKLAEQEARTAYLRNKARVSDGNRFGNIQPQTSDVRLKASDGTDARHKTPDKTDARHKASDKTNADIYTADGNINFFKDLEDGKQTEATNKEYEAEKKAEQEKYEKSIGYLTYLGQNSHEAKGDKAWYETESVAQVIDSCKLAETDEVGLKSKAKLDPINDIIKYTGLKPVKKNTLATNLNVKASVVEMKNIEKSVSPGQGRRDLEHFVCNEEVKQSKRHKKKYKKEHKKKRKKMKRAHKSEKLDSNSSKKGKDRERDRGQKRKRYDSSDSEDKYSNKSCRKSKKRDCSDDDTDSEDSDISSDSSDDREHRLERQKQLEVLRAERLKREAEERRRAERLLAGQKSDGVEIAAAKASFQQKYNSQFNPHIARQNQEPKTLEAGVKYWLQ